MAKAEKATADYARLVAEAEASVASVKDPELKRVAFEKILSTLLEGGLVAPASGRSLAKKKAAKSEKRASAANARSGPTAYIQELIDDTFFASPRTIADVKAELANRGHHIPLTSLSGPLQSLTQQRLLRRQKAAGASGKNTFAYSNW